MLKLHFVSLACLLVSATTLINAAAVQLSRRDDTPAPVASSYEDGCGAGSDPKHPCVTFWQGSLNDADVNIPNDDHKSRQFLFAKDDSGHGGYLTTFLSLTVAAGTDALFFILEQTSLSPIRSTTSA